MLESPATTHGPACGCDGGGEDGGYPTPAAFSQREKGQKGREEGGRARGKGGGERPLLPSSWLWHVAPAITRFEQTV
eukprot:COSAG05_NODE_816_length_7150_cov_3.975606_8_plen_77_part_00